MCWYDWKHGLYISILSKVFMLRVQFPSSTLMINDILPERPLYMHEVNALMQNSDKINNSEAVFYEENNLNSIICFFMNVNESGYILGFDNQNKEWVKLSSIESKNKEVYDEQTDSVIDWIENRYDNYGVYGVDDEEDDKN